MNILKFVITNKSRKRTDFTHQQYFLGYLRWWYCISVVFFLVIYFAQWTSSNEQCISFLLLQSAFLYPFPIWWWIIRMWWTEQFLPPAQSFYHSNTNMNADGQINTYETQKGRCTCMHTKTHQHIYMKHIQNRNIYQKKLQNSKVKIDLKTLF